ncbi:MAG: hypothetical protein VX705_08785 [Verrucomicrobiota bacterium]|nr:hypothetical protein [Verrucomicrobiota bacterium]
MPKLSEQEEAIYAALSSEERAFDDIVEATRLPVSEVNVGLLQLELKRLARQLPGRLFMKNR